MPQTGGMVTRYTAYDVSISKFCGKGLNVL